MTALDTIEAAWCDGIRPDELLTVSEWADRYRILDGRASSEPGQWSTDRSPHLREPMDRLGNEDPCQDVSIMAASQTGKTEIIINWSGYTIHQSPCPMLIVQPTIDTAEKFSKQRIAPTIASTPQLAERVTDPRSRDSGNTLLVKEYQGGVLIIAGANSPAGLASMPIRRVACDEVDRYDESAGTEGDPVDLAEQRTAAFTNRKRLRCSTPGNLSSSRIHKSFLEGDQRHYHVPCPDCHEMQTLEWEQVTWTPGHPEEAVYVCPHCGCTIEDRQKDWMLPRGQWIPANPDASPLHHSYYLSGLCSPHGLGWSWGEIATAYVKAKGDPERLKVWRNTKLGLPFDEIEGTSLSEAELLKRCEPFRAPVPAGVGLLTAGVDVQDDRLHVEIVGWGVGEESWSIDYRIIPGDPSGPKLWEDLDKHLGRTWRHEDGGLLTPVAVCVDSGGHHTQAVLTYCAGRAARRVWAIKGVSGHKPIFARKPSRAVKGKWLFYAVGTWSAKDQVLGRLALDKPGEGYTHVPEGRGIEWFQEMTAERKTVSRRGDVEWVKLRKRNEALDCRVYAYAALHSLLLSGHTLQRAVDSRTPRADHGVAVPAPRPVKPARNPNRYMARFVNGCRD